MHYGKTYFTKNGKNTIQKIGDPNSSFGQRGGFSDNDKLQLNKLYSCSSEFLINFSEIYDQIKETSLKYTIFPVKNKASELLLMPGYEEN
jgi:hypothetical protein